jgi:hypothetical protein
MGNPVSVETIDRATLTPVVRKALRSDTAEVMEWECRPIYGAGFIAGIFRFSGRARDQGSDVPWSLILKSINTTAASPDLAHYRYGLREVFVYQSGLLDDLPGGLAAPACYSTVQPSDDVFWIWLEDIREVGDICWPLDAYGCTARHLGQFNGAYLAGTPLPAYRWLSRNWLRMWLNFWMSPTQQIPIFSDLPVHRRLTPPDIADGITHFMDEIPVLLDALDRLPQTLCHQDAYHRNLFHQSSGRTVAIDWADMGIAAVGVELSSFVPSSLMFFGANLTDAHELDQIAFAGYMDGLADAGWHGDPRVVRFGYVASAALRWIPFPFSYAAINYSEMMEQSFRRPLDEINDNIIGVRRFLLELADEARELLPVVV